MPNDLNFEEGFTIGYQRLLQAKADGNKLKVFDWNEAAALIKNTKPLIAEAGLGGDWPSTGGIIWQDGKPITDQYTYLASLWATPALMLYGKTIDCWKYFDDAIGWNENTKWPSSALMLINGVN
jgi:hypothetical protein